MSVPITPVVTAEPEPALEPVTSAAAAAEPDWLPKRLERAERSAVSKALEEMGVASVEEAKAKLEDAEKVRQQQMTDAEKAALAATAEKDRADKAEAALAERDARDLRAKIAAEFKLPDVLASRLAGTTEDELKADAAALLEGLPAQSDGVPSPAGTSAPVGPVLASTTDPITAAVMKTLGP